MHSNDLDDILQDLEKQVQDLSLALDESGNEYYIGHHEKGSAEAAAAVPARNNSNSNNNIDNYNNNQKSDEVSPHSTTIMTADDNVALSQLQHHAITTYAHDHSTTPVIPTSSHSSSRSASIRHAFNKLTRSVSSGGSTLRSNKRPQEPVPPLPNHHRDNIINNNDEAELIAAAQCAWAVLDGAADDTTTKKQQQQQQQPFIPPAAPRQHEAPKRVPRNAGFTICIYINDLATYKAVQLTDLLTTAMVVQYFKRKGLLDQADDWALFEVANSHGVERPLRDWEIVLDTVLAWDGDMHNMLMLKKYPYRSSLTAESVLQPLHPPKHGWLLVETRKGKWQKRFCFIQDNAVQYAKDSKGTGAVVVCHLSNFDVYTLTQPVRGAPTKYVFGLRAQDKAKMYENPEDYLSFLCAEDSESFMEFVLGIRCAKGAMQYQSNPQRVLHPLNPPLPPAPPAENSNGEVASSDDQPLARGNTIRRYKSMRDIRSKDNSNSSGKLSHSGTLRHRDQQQATPQQSVDDEDEQGSNTLIQIDDKVKFAKGSLLAQRETAAAAAAATSMGTVGLSRSKSTREKSEVTENGGEYRQHRRYHSVRRRDPRPTAKGGDIPAVPAVPTGNKTLLQLEGTPEQIHTRQLRERQMKPLLNFDESTTAASVSRR